MSENNKNQFEGLVDSLLKGMDTALSTKTVVGSPTQIGDTIIVPLVDVSFGFAAGAGANDTKTSASAAGGLGGKMSPSAVLVIKDGVTKMVNVKNQDTVTKVLDMLPELVDKFTKKDEGMTDRDIRNTAFPEEEATEV